MLYPPGCDTPPERTEYAYRYQELLRLLHNEMGKWYKTGITKEEWNKLPLKIQQCYSYEPQLTLTQWRDFLSTMFVPLQDKIVGAILTQRGLLKESTTWTITLEL